MTENNFIIRPWSPADRPALIRLWHTVFGDDVGWISSFMDIFLRDNGCIVGEADNSPVSACFILSGHTMRPYRQFELPTAYCYAMCTLPEYRGRGIGGAVYRRACRTALEHSDLFLTLPAEESLYDYYKSLQPQTELGSIREARLSRSELDGISRPLCARIPAGHYAGIRRAFLGGMPYVDYSESFVDFLETTYDDDPNTGFFMLDNGIASAELLPGGVCRIGELLAPDMDFMSVCAGVAAFCRADSYIVRTPVFFNAPGEIKHFMLAAYDRKPACYIPDDLWFGLALE